MSTLTCGIDGSTGQEIIDEINRQSLLFRGNLWSGAVSYQAGDVQSYNDQLHVALVPSIGLIPPDNPASWSVILSAGHERGGVTWRSGIAYVVGYIVGYLSKAYLCVQATGTVMPGNDPDYWKELAFDADLSALDIAFTSHEADVANPHTVTKSQVGLGSADNTTDLNKPISIATQAALDDLADSDDLAAHVADLNNPHVVSKTQVGLGDVDNTSDVVKPISTATQTALDTKMDDSQADDYYLKTDYIEDNSGGSPAGKPIVLNSSGQVDPSFIETNAFRPVAPWTPVPGNEYPDSTGANHGDFWWIEEVTDPYTFVDAGDLQGRQIRNGDFMVWGTEGWGIMIGEMNPLLYYKLDGSLPVSAAFNGGGFPISLIADGTADTDAVTISQHNTKNTSQDDAITLNTAKVTGADRLLKAGDLMDGDFEVAYTGSLSILDTFSIVHTLFTYPDGNMNPTFGQTGQAIDCQGSLRFYALPECSLVPSSLASLVNKKYVIDSLRIGEY